MIPLLLALGCSGKDSISTDSGGASDSSAPVDDGVSPKITEATAECAEHTTGDTFFQWNFSSVYEDPQGLENVPTSGTFHLVRVERDGNVVKEMELMACNGGSCVGSASDDQLGTNCTSADEYDVTFVMTDYDGNTGELTVTGEGP